MTFINVYTTWKSASMIDDIYLNAQRAHLLFNDYLAEGNDKVPSMKEINDKQVFQVPKFMNWQHCRFIRYGEQSISQVLGMSQPNYYVTSLMHQLHKEGRNFVYYIKLLPWWKRPFSTLTNNGRPYIIQLNMKNSATNIDQISAFYFARLLDLELAKLYINPEKKVDYHSIQNCIRIAELNFSQVDIDEFVRALKEVEWSLDYIYLDRKRNTYEFKLEHVQTVIQSQEESESDSDAQAS